MYYIIIFNNSFNLFYLSNLTYIIISSYVSPLTMEIIYYNIGKGARIKLNFIHFEINNFRILKMILDNYIYCISDLKYNNDQIIFKEEVQG